MIRYVRFRTDDDDRPRWGVRDGDDVAVLETAPWLGTRRTSVALPADRVRVLAPAEPTKILALGYNYKALFGDPAALARKTEAHYTDPGFEPLVFLKAPNSLADPEATVRIPDTEVWVEVEIAAVIGRRARDLREPDAARDVVAGLTIGNDITALNILGRDWHLARSKSLDGFCPLGPELVVGFDDADVRMTTAIGGRITQDGTTADRVLDTYASVALASRIMTLEPGDVVLTGTPLGGRQSVVRAGDRVELAIAGLGTLANTIAGARA
ncbi:MAG: fumarylacetoacetate hydrolase family protein [Deltaproteobacteria bacterium]|nr:fumarylacetoacetate hydrolase family protein [Deltaproteobacteria bacterium]